MNKTILAATDGTPAARGALRFAQALAMEKGWRVHVLGVVEPVPVLDAGFMVALPEMEVYESRREAMRQEVAGQVEAVAGARDAWPVSIQAGVPGTRIVQHAEELEADVIAMGLGRHGPMDRVFGTETALQVLRVSHLPVLAVPETTEALPRSVLLAVDFSMFSRRAAIVSAELLQAPAEIHLVHVLSGMEFLPTISEQWRDDYQEEVLERLTDLSTELEAVPGCETRFHVLEGEPSHQILTFAKGKNIDMLAAGSHGHSFVGRLMMGSVSTRLVRASDVPVLVVPPTDRPEEVLEDGREEGALNTWARELQEFSRANAGRRTTLRLEDPEIGIQECGKEFPLWGAVYDAKRDRVDMMLGRSGTVDGHLTHSLPAPKSIEIQRRDDGKAEALVIQLRTGRAVLWIHRD